MTTIKRTPRANSPRSAAWVSDPYSDQVYGYADYVEVSGYPTHSPVLGPDGHNLEYEAPPPMGFDLRRPAQ